MQNKANLLEKDISVRDSIMVVCILLLTGEAYSLQSDFSPLPSKSNANALANLGSVLRPWIITARFFTPLLIMITIILLMLLIHYRPRGKKFISIIHIIIDLIWLGIMIAPELILQESETMSTSVITVWSNGVFSIIFAGFWGMLGMYLAMKFGA